MYDFFLPSLLRNNDYIILDRWSLSTIVYGSAEGVDVAFSELLASKLIYPDYTILLLGKSHMQHAEDVYEADDSLQKSVKKLYENWSTHNSSVSSIINCSLTREEVFDQVKSSLQNANIIL